MVKLREQPTVPPAPKPPSPFAVLRARLARGVDGDALYQQADRT